MKFNSTLLKTTVAMLCAFCFGLAGSFAAKESKPGEARGTIKSVDVNMHWLLVTEVKKKTEQKFQWNDQTKFTEHGKTASATDLKEGERVRLTYTKSGDLPLLQQVHIAPAKADKHASAHRDAQARS